MAMHLWPADEDVYLILSHTSFLLCALCTYNSCICGKDPSTKILEVEPPAQETFISHSDRAESHWTVTQTGIAGSPALW
jgi:hypothetical protein